MTKDIDDKKIRVVSEETPTREGSGWHKRVQAVLRHNGKTVGTFKGARTDVTWCLKKKLIKLADA